MKFVVANCLLLCALVLSHTGVAEPLTGDTAVARGTPEACESNPANAAFIKRSQLQVTPPLYTYESLLVRYPGIESVDQTSSGFSLPTSMPSYVKKYSPKLGVGGFLIPPLPITLPINKKEIPLVVLNTLNYMDIDGEIKLNGYISLFAGYKTSPKLAVGLKADYLSYAADATVTPSEGGAEVAKIHIEQTELNVKGGVRYHVIPHKVSLGFSSGLLVMQNTTTTIDSALLPEGDESTNSAGVVNPLDSFLAGGTFQTGSLALFLDIEYNRAAPGTSGTSLKKLKKAEKDVYDTVALRTGMKYKTSPTQKWLAGFRYEPASLGPGGPAEEDKSGFGSYELLEILAFGGDVKPYWQVGLGFEGNFQKISSRKPSKNKGKNKKNSKKRKIKKPAKRADGYYQWTVAAGCAYRRASLGIDENGEMPGAYMQSKFWIPMSITYRL